MAKDQGVNIAARTMKRPARALAPAKTPAGSPSAAAQPAPKKRTSPAEFWRQVRAEVRKITWPSWKETWITSVMVFIMVAVTAIFFGVVNGVLSLFMEQLLKLATG